jgi:hypothetical protein
MTAAVARPLHTCGRHSRSTGASVPPAPNASRKFSTTTGMTVASQHPGQQLAATKPIRRDKEAPAGFACNASFSPATSRLVLA